MTAQEFRAAVERAFGPRLERATPDNVARFVAAAHERSAAVDPESSRYVLDDDPEESVEEGVKRFLLDALLAPPEAARQRLWVALLEVWFAIIETTDAETFDRIFDDLDLTDEGARP